MGIEVVFYLTQHAHVPAQRSKGANVLAMVQQHGGSNLTNEGEERNVCEERNQPNQGGGAMRNQLT